MKRILIVEDEPWLSEAYAASLAVAGFDVEVVRDGQAAIEVIDAHKPAAIVLDWLLPGANGLQLLHELKSHADLQTIPIVLCSSQQLNLDTTQQRAYGIVQCLRKSEVTPQILADIVRDAIS